MAESVLDLRGLDRREAYRALAETVERTLEGIDDRTCAMATIASLTHHAFGHLWTGFYNLVAPELLRVGPYQGTLGCLEIAVGRGVCGAAASTRRTQVVPDVHAFPGHITCDARSRSEIVVPVLDARCELIAVFDVDSAEPAAFDERDAEGLEHVLAWFRASRG